MASTTFVDKTTIINTNWLNDVNALVWSVFNGMSSAGTASTWLRSNGTNIVNSTTTIPDTFAINTIPYASAANVLSALATANSAVLTTSAGGVPQWNTTGLPIGQGGTNSTTALSGSTIMISNGTAIIQGTAGTSTQVLHGNAAGSPTYSSVTANDFGTQTANTVLAGPTSGGAATPTFRNITGADGASLILIQRQVASGAPSQIDFTTGIGSTYDTYILEITDYVPGTDNTSLILRVSEDGGTTFKSGATDYRETSISNTDGGAVTVAGGTAAGIDTMLNVGNVGNRQSMATIKFSTPTVAKYKLFTVDATIMTTANNITLYSCKGIFQLDTNTINAIRLIPSSGTITSGNFALYGLKQS